MKCPFCKNMDCPILESRTADEGWSLYRKRECLECHKIFITYEFEEKHINEMNKKISIIDKLHEVFWE